MTKLPDPPGVAELRDIEPQIYNLPAATHLARVYFSGGDHPSHWNQFRSFGPTGARWDHHLPTHSGGGIEQDRAILYCAPDVDTCVAEVFQATRRIDRIRNAPALVIFAPCKPIPLLDLRGTFATKMGTSTAINSGPRSRVRVWAREIYAAYPDIHGVYYGSSMNGHAPAIALNERARGAMPELPLFNRALNDDMMVEILQKIGVRLSYGLR